MMLYRVWAKFDPGYTNPLTGRPGLWRVVNSYLINRLPANHDPFWIDGDELGIVSIKHYQPGSIIRPHKELNRVIRRRREDSNLH